MKSKKSKKSKSKRSKGRYSDEEGVGVESPENNSSPQQPEKQVDKPKMNLLVETGASSPNLYESDPKADLHRGPSGNVKNISKYRADVIHEMNEESSAEFSNSVSSDSNGHKGNKNRLKVDQNLAKSKNPMPYDYSADQPDISSESQSYGSSAQNNQSGTENSNRNVVSKRGYQV